MLSAGQEVYDAIRKAVDDPYGDLATYVGAVTDELIQEMEDMVRDSGSRPGWSALLDLNRIPDQGLPYLAQFTGVRFPSSLSPADQRIRIARTDGWNRGTPAAIAAAPLPYLTGNKTVILRERDPAACAGQPEYGLTVITYLNETPVADWPATNLMPDPSFEAGITNWNAGNATLSWSTDVARSGTHCLKSVRTATGGASNIGAYISMLLTAQIHCASAYVWVPSAFDGTFFVLTDDGSFTGDIGDTAATGPALANLALRDQWQRIYYTFTPVAGDLNGFPFVFRHDSTAGKIVYIDDVQLENNPAPSPFVVGSRPAGSDKILAALLDQKPAGIILSYRVLSGEDYQSLLINHPLYSNVFADFATYQGVATATPGT